MILLTIMKIICKPIACEALRKLFSGESEIWSHVQSRLVIRVSRISTDNCCGMVKCYIQLRLHT